MNTWHKYLTLCVTILGCRWFGEVVHNNGNSFPLTSRTVTVTVEASTPFARMPVAGTATAPEIVALIVLAERRIDTSADDPETIAARIAELLRKPK